MRVRLIGLAVLAAAAPAAFAAGPWGAPVPVASGPGQGGFPVVAAAERGAPVVVWYAVAPSGSARLLAGVPGRPGAGSRQALGPAALSPGPALPPQPARVALAADGTGWAAWMRPARGGTQVVAARRGPDGRFGAPVVVSPPGDLGSYPDVAVAADGSALVVWVPQSPGPDPLRARGVTPDGGRGPVLTVSARDASVAAPALAVTPGGDAVVVWRQDLGASGPVFASVRTKGAPFTPPRRVSAANVYADQIDVAVDPRGRATAVWAQAAGANGVPRAAAAWTSGRGRPFGPVQVVSAPGVEAIGAGVAVDGRGTALTAWVGVPPDGQAGASVAQAATRPAGGRFGPSRTLDRAQGPVSFERPAVAVAADGRAVAAWERDLPTGRSEVRAAVGPAGRLGRVATVSRGDGGFPRVAMSGAAGAVAVWSVSGPGGLTGAEAARAR